MVCRALCAANLGSGARCEQAKPQAGQKKKEKIISLPNCAQISAAQVGTSCGLCEAELAAKDQIVPYLYLGGMAAATDVEGRTLGVSMGLFVCILSLV